VRWIDTILWKEQSRIQDKYPIILLKHHDRWSSLNPPRKLQNESSWHRCQICLDCEQQSENSILVLMCLESEEKLIKRVIEYFLIFPIVFARPDTINGLGVMQFWSLCGAKLSNLEKPELLTPNPIQSQETSNNSIVYNVLRFLTVTHIPQSDSRLRSYDLWELLVATGNSGLDWMKWLG
jgi:hypothetical protein